MIMKTFAAILLLCFIVLTVPSHGQPYKGNITFGGETRDYMVYLPGSYNESAEFPLVIYLHAYGRTAQQGMDYSQLHVAAETSGYIAAYPSAAPNWNSGISDNPYFSTPDHDDVGFIDVLIDTLRGRYSIDNSRVYACGFSNGGFMAYRLACELGHRIAAVASVGGVHSNTIAAGCNPVRTVPVLHIHGTGDFVVPPDGNEHWPSVDQTLDYWTTRNNCAQADSVALADTDPGDGCTVTRYTYRNSSGITGVEYYRILGGGHTWPGAGPIGVPLGNTNHDIDANAVILSFFDDITNPLTDIGETGNQHVPKDYSLEQNYPNPFTASTTIRFALPKPMTASLIVTDALGREVWRAAASDGEEWRPAGRHSVMFDGSGLPSGMYFYRLETDKTVPARKMLLLK
jgi:polyhydroxybutyrate depolymerase